MTKQEFLNLPNEQKFIYRGKEYKLYRFGNGLSSVSDNHLFGSSMNVCKVTDKYVSLFGYDMMDQRTNYKMGLSEITLSVV
jgi:hypothetical protein